MARPKKCRNICGRPAYSCYKPNGVPMLELEQTELLAEEFEALRLADYQNMSQQQAADQMGVSRQTFGNIINQARLKVAESLVKGNALVLSGVERPELKDIKQ